MSENLLKIKYTCHHPSCVVHCKNGELTLTESQFTHLSSFFENEKFFRSPRNACRLGFSQPFEALATTVIEDGATETKTENTGDDRNPAKDPIAALMHEHNLVLEKAAKVEEQLAKRDIDGLWVSTTDLDNILHLHSGIKEEEVLFPAMRGLVPFGEGLVACINEDHREIVSLIHAFREALRDGTINDKVIGSALVALRSHTRKEDNEFFEFVRKYITDDMKQALMEDLERAEKAFVPKEAGERLPDAEKEAERKKFHEKAMITKENACDTCCH